MFHCLIDFLFIYLLFYLFLYLFIYNYYYYFIFFFVKFIYFPKNPFYGRSMPFGPGLDSRNVIRHFSNCNRHLGIGVS